MQKAKQALLKAGRIKAITRGRISVDNHQWLAEQYAAGVRFSDWEPKQSGEPSKTKAVGKVKRLTEVSAEFYIESIFWPENLYKAVDENGKERSMREVCNNCRYSLVVCHCGKPVILGDTRVTIVRR